MNHSGIVCLRLFFAFPTHAVCFRSEHDASFEKGDSRCLPTDFTLDASGAGYTESQNAITFWNESICGSPELFRS